MVEDSRGNEKFIIAGREFRSRLMVGTGKYDSFEIMGAAIEASGAEIVTVAVRRVNIDKPNEPSLLDHIDRKKYFILPNTAGCATAEEAVKFAKLAREAGFSNWVKLEVIPDPKYLLPDPLETVLAAEQLIDDGFVVLPYINADPVLAKRLEQVGTATVMPLAAPIGTGRGMLNWANIQVIIEQSDVPVVVDAGLGVPSDAAKALEMGADAVLINTAIAEAKNPSQMAAAMRLGVEAGRQAYLAGRMSIRDHASASSPAANIGQ